MRFFEEFAQGQIFRAEGARIDAADIKAFATQFDPQPFHIDEEAAKATVFGGLAASGWHTAALTMRLIVQSDLNPAGGGVGLGVESLRWLAPVRPGDALRIEIEVTDIKPHRSRATHGIVTMRTTTYNQKDEAVQVFVTSIIVLRRSAAENASEGQATLAA